MSIGLLGSAFKLFGKGFVTDLMGEAQAPLAGLFIGILATTLVQSSSVTTSASSSTGEGQCRVTEGRPAIAGLSDAMPSPRTSRNAG